MLSTSSATAKLGPTAPFAVRFYDPELYAKDSEGRNLDTIMRFRNDQLEHYHDYIQILFPLPEQSPYNPLAPVVTEEVFRTFRATKSNLRFNVHLAWLRMLNFYGLKAEIYHDDEQPVKDLPDGLNAARFKVVTAPSFNGTQPFWVRKFNHNHLRITRIIRSLRVLGLEPEAEAFMRALHSVNHMYPGKIGEKSLLFWERAAERPLYLAPEDEADHGQGKKFLYDFEAASPSHADVSKMEIVKVCGEGHNDKLRFMQPFPKQANIEGGILKET